MRKKHRGKNVAPICHSCSSGQGSRDSRSSDQNVSMKNTAQPLDDDGDFICHTTPSREYSSRQAQPEVPFPSSSQSCPQRKLLKGRWILRLRGPKKSKPSGSQQECASGNLLKGMIPTPSLPSSPCRRASTSTEQNRSTLLYTPKSKTSSQCSGSGGSVMGKVSYAKALTSEETDIPSLCPRSCNTTIFSGPSTRQPAGGSCSPPLALKATTASNWLQPITSGTASALEENSRCETSLAESSGKGSNTSSTPCNSDYGGKSNMAVKPELPTSSLRMTSYHSSNSPTITRSVQSLPTSAKHLVQRLQPDSPPFSSSPYEDKKQKHCPSTPIEKFEGFSPFKGWSTSSPRTSFRSHETQRQKEATHSLSGTLLHPSPYGNNTRLACSPVVKVIKLCLSPVSDSLPPTVTVKHFEGDPSHQEVSNIHKDVVDDAIVPSLPDDSNTPFNRLDRSVSPLHLARMPAGNDWQYTRLTSSSMTQAGLSRNTTSARSSKNNSTPTPPSKDNMAPTGPSKNHNAPTGPSKNHNAPTGPSKNHNTPTGPSKNHNTPTGPSKNHSAPTGPSKNHNVSTGPSKNHNVSTGPHKNHNESTGPSKNHTISIEPSKNHNSPMEPSKKHTTLGELSLKHMAPGKSLNPGTCSVSSKQFSSPVEYAKEINLSGTPLKLVVRRKHKSSKESTLPVKPSTDPSTPTISSRTFETPVTSSMTSVKSSSASDNLSVVTMPVLESAVSVGTSVKPKISSMPPLIPVTPNKPLVKSKIQYITNTENTQVIGGVINNGLTQEPMSKPDHSVSSTLKPETLSPRLPFRDKTNLKTLNEPQRKPIQSVHIPCPSEPATVSWVETATSTTLTKTILPPVSSTFEDLHPITCPPFQGHVAAPYRTKLHTASLDFLPKLKERYSCVVEGQNPSTSTKTDHFDKGSHKISPDKCHTSLLMKNEGGASRTQPRSITAGTKMLNQEALPPPDKQGHKATLRGGCESRKKAAPTGNRVIEPQDLQRNITHTHDSKGTGLESLSGPHQPIPPEHKCLPKRKRSCKANILRKDSKDNSKQNGNDPLPMNSKESLGATVSLNTVSRTMEEDKDEVGMKTFQAEHHSIMEKEVTSTQPTITSPNPNENINMRPDVNERHRDVVLSPRVIIVKINNKMIKNATKWTEEAKHKKTKAKKTGKEKKEKVRGVDKQNTKKLKPKTKCMKDEMNKNKLCPPPISNPSNTSTATSGMNGSEAKMDKGLCVSGGKNKKYTYDNEGIFISQKEDTPHPLLAQPNLELSIKQKETGTGVVDMLFKKLHLDQETMESTASSKPPITSEIHIATPPSPTQLNELRYATPGHIMTLLPRLSQALKSLPMSRSKLMKPRRSKQRLLPATSSLPSPVKYHSTSGEVTVDMSPSIVKESDDKADKEPQPNSCQLVSSEKDLEDFDLREKVLTHPGVERRKGKCVECSEKDRELNHQVPQERRVDGKLNQQVEERVDKELTQQVEGKVNEKLNQQVKGRLNEKVKQHVEGKMDDKIKQVEGKVDDKLNQQMKGRFNRKIKQVDDKLTQQVEGKVEEKLREQVEERVDRELTQQVEGKVGNKLTQQVKGRLNRKVKQVKGNMNDKSKQQMEEKVDDKLTQQEGKACPSEQKTTKNTKKDSQNMKKRTRKRKSSTSLNWKEEEESITQTQEKTPSHRNKRTKPDHANTPHTQAPSTHPHTGPIDTYMNTAPKMRTPTHTNATNTHIGSVQTHMDVNHTNTHINQPQVHTSPMHTLMNGPHMYTNTPCRHVNHPYAYMNTPGMYMNMPYMPINTPKMHMNPLYRHTSTPYMHMYPTDMHMNPMYAHSNFTYAHINTPSAYMKTPNIHKNSTSILTIPKPCRNTLKTYMKIPKTHMKSPKVYTDLRRTHTTPSVHATPSHIQAKVNKYRLHSSRLQRARHLTNHT